MELVMTLVVMGIILGLMPSAMDSVTTNSIRSEIQTTAAFLAKEKMEEVMLRKSVLREVGYSRIPPLVPQALIFIGPNPFSRYTYRIRTQFVDYVREDSAYPAVGITFEAVLADEGYMRVTVDVFAPGVPNGVGDRPTASLTTVIADYGD